MLPPLAPDPARLAADIRAWSLAHVETLLERYLPGAKWPRLFAGHAVSPNDVADLAYVAAHLHRAGVPAAAGMSVPDLAAAALRQVHGPSCNTFYSYRVAETLLEFPDLFPRLPAAEQANLRDATDSTSIYVPATGTLTAPNNYSAVLARCEHRRLQLGFTADSALYDTCLARVDNLLASNPAGYLDDSPDRRGRFDLYTADFLLFLEPLFPRLAQAPLARALATHARLLHDLAHPSGALVVWGRSIGALSVCATLELAALTLRSELPGDRARTFALAAHAFDRLRTWFDADGLTSAHRHRSPYKYRDVPRLLQMSLDLLGKALYAAEHLSHVGPVPALDAPLFPAADTWTPFAETDKGHAGVWSYRTGGSAWAVHLPVVAGVEADYVPAPKQPGLLDAPSDSDILSFAPRVFANGIEYTTAGPAARVAHAPGRLTLTYDRLTPARKSPPNTPPLPATREVTFAFDGPHLHVSERLSFPNPPDHIHYDVAESDLPLNVRSDTPHSTVSTDGFYAFRSYFTQVRALHQFAPPAATDVAFSYRLTPALRVVNLPGPHDYNRALFDAFPPGTVAERRVEQGIPPLPPDKAHFDHIVGDASIFHFGWPEHLFARPEGMSEAEHDALHDRFVADLRRSGVTVVWTQHNRRPHAKTAWPDARADRLYALYASVAHGVIHHSEVGRATMLPDLPWRPDAVHVVIPHGHFGPQMATPHPRAKLEQIHKVPALPEGGVRFGILGRYQPEKQIETLIDAFLAAAPPQHQLVVTAHNEQLLKTYGEAGAGRDPRLFLLPRPQWLSRPLIAEHTHLCDVLLAAHTGERYLTSGIQADALATGATMLVPDWPFFRETLADAVFYHDNSPAQIRHLLATLTPQDYAAARTRIAALAPRYAWPLLAQRTLDLYYTLLHKAAPTR